MVQDNDQVQMHRLPCTNRCQMHLRMSKTRVELLELLKYDATIQDIHVLEIKPALPMEKQRA